jgi:hypothetical protein
MLSFAVWVVVYAVRLDDVVDDVDRRPSMNAWSVSASGLLAVLLVVGVATVVGNGTRSAVCFRCLRVQPRPRVRKLLVLFEWRRGDRVAGGDGGEPEDGEWRSSVLAAKTEK